MMTKFQMRRGKRRREWFSGDEVDPTEGLINLADLMLVFACGLMLALMFYWNIDIKHQDMVTLKQEKNVSKINGIQENIEKSDSGGNGYQKMGTVFRDPQTGQLYMLKD